MVNFFLSHISCEDDFYVESFKNAMNLAPCRKLLECHQYMSNKMLSRTGAKGKPMAVSAICL